MDQTQGHRTWDVRPGTQDQERHDPRFWTYVFRKCFNFCFQKCKKSCCLRHNAVRIKFSLLFLRNIYFYWASKWNVESKKILTHKCDNAKYPFIYFLFIKLVVHWRKIEKIFNPKKWFFAKKPTTSKPCRHLICVKLKTL